MVKVLAILGSPRPNSNSTYLARVALAAAKEKGAAVEEIVLQDVQPPIRPCINCDSCHIAGRCVMKDGYQTVYDQMLAADALILSTPIWWSDTSSQFKLFWDRNYCLIDANDHARLPPGKRVLFITTQGDPDTNRFKDILERFRGSCEWCGFTLSGTLQACGLSKPGAVASMPEIINKAKEEGAKLVQ
eukprot:TRINITY_DN50_c0_g3_i1.p1 TRINITY_DN50_c0_g3~~TRINITY_DN50_c0_g3_i1.p1  ORF type:complete len:188 (-),score=49.07 TRINITY_DN50_c0_g3_i1:657-1220(-)